MARYYTAAMIGVADKEKQAAGRAALTSAGLLNRRKFHYTPKGRAAAEAYVAKMTEVLSPLGLLCHVNEGAAICL